MAKIRSIHPEACESADLERLSDGAERTWWRLLTHTDDEGRGKADPQLLAAKLYPLHADKDAGEIKAHLSELVDAGLIVTYTAGGKDYYAVPTFGDYQKPKYRSSSKLPPPPDSPPPVTPRSSPDRPPIGSTPSPGIVTGGDRTPVGRGGSARTVEPCPDRPPIGSTPAPDVPHGVGVGVGVGEGEEQPIADAADAPTGRAQPLTLVPPHPPPDPYAGFEEFWDTYPRHRDNGKPGGGGSKSKTRDKWRRLKPAERAACLVAVTHYAADVQARDAPVAHTTTWLNERRWEGWQTPADPPTRSRPGDDAGEAHRHDPTHWLPTAQGHPR
jgi:hypothetical protein